MKTQSASQFLMIKPANFAFNPETNRTNHYQYQDERSPEEVYADSLREFEALLALYRAHDVDVLVYENKDPQAPDAIFPNSVSTFPFGVFKGEKKGGRSAILHPMLEPSRRRERSAEFVRYLTDTLGYTIRHDLSGHEKQGLALEGTGSVVMDHVHRVAYCAISDRSDAKIAGEFAGLIGYKPIIFRTQDHNTRPIYHTDVLMYVGDGYIGLCTSCIHDEDRERVVESAARHHELVDISMKQLRHFCGNAVQVQNRKGEKFLAMSTQAFNAMTPDQVEIIRQRVEIIHVDVSTIERNGGGSVRCMTQELF